jgi:excinuclease UvrABC nuclease subunit
MSKKTVKYDSASIDKLPNDKPVVYKIKTEGGNNNYTGVAKKGRVKDRIKEHIGTIPGAKVEIEQCSSIADAVKKETSVIKKSKPKYNIKGK